MIEAEIKLETNGVGEVNLVINSGGQTIMHHNVTKEFSKTKSQHEAELAVLEDNFSPIGVKRCIHEEIISFTYDTPEQRLSHVRYMQSKGWDNDGQVRRLKEGHSVWDSANKDAYECFARFYKSY